VKLYCITGEIGEGVWKTKRAAPVRGVSSGSHVSCTGTGRIANADPAVVAPCGRVGVGVACGLWPAGRSPAPARPSRTGVRHAHRLTGRRIVTISPAEQE